MIDKVSDESVIENEINNGIKKFWKKFWKISLGLVISFILLYLIFNKVSLNTIWNKLQEANYFYVILGTLIFLLAPVVSAIRFDKVLRASNFTGVTFGSLFRIFSMSMMINNILPARAGEVAKGLFLMKREKTSFGTALATVLGEKLLDLIVVILFASIPFFFYDFEKPIAILIPKLNKIIPGIASYNFYYVLKISIFFGFCLIFASIIMMLIFRKDYLKVIAVIKKIVFWLPEEHKLFKTLENIFSELKFFNHPKELITIIIFSVILWHVYALNMYFVMKGFDINVPYIGLLFVVGMVGLGIAIPAGPGALGAYELSFSVSVFFIVDNLQWEVAAGCALVLHMSQIIIISILGLPFFLRENFTLKEISDKQIEEDI